MLYPVVWEDPYFLQGTLPGGSHLLSCLILVYLCGSYLIFGESLINVVEPSCSNLVSVVVPLTSSFVLSLCILPT